MEGKFKLGALGVGTTAGDLLNGTKITLGSKKTGCFAAGDDANGAKPIGGVTNAGALLGISVGGAWVGVGLACGDVTGAAGADGAPRTDGTITPPPTTGGAAGDC
jgi:hypothetical protein